MLIVEEYFIKHIKTHYAKINQQNFTSAYIIISNQMEIKSETTECIAEVS